MTQGPLQPEIVGACSDELIDFRALEYFQRLSLASISSPFSLYQFCDMDVRPPTTPSRKLSKLDKPDMRDIPGKVEMYSGGPLPIHEQRYDDQLEPIYSSSMTIRDIALKTCRKQWTIGEVVAREESGISILMAWREDIYIYIYIYIYVCIILFLTWFLHQRKLMVFHWMVRDSKSPQVSSRTLLSILTDLNNSEVWISSIVPLITTHPDPLPSVWGLFLACQLYHCYT